MFHCLLGKAIQFSFHHCLVFSEVVNWLGDPLVNVQYVLASG